MEVFRRSRQRYLPSLFFSFGAVCGILTARCAAISLVSATTEAIRSFFAVSAVGACVLSVLAVPVLLLLLGMTLFGAFLILPGVLLAGGAVGWALCCLMRMKLPWGPTLLPLICLLLPQVPCLMQIAASCMRLSASLRVMASGSGLRRPDISAELRNMAVSFSVLLLSAVLAAMLLRRWFPY